MEKGNGVEPVSSLFKREIGLVSKPGRYLGIEVNARRKPLSERGPNCVLVYPDVYEIGMSHLGLAILYEEINDREDSMADRAYLPWVDMQELMERKGIPLFGLESKVPLGRFDLVGITLQHELTYANVLRILSLAGIPLRAVDREDSDPLVVGGGPGAYNPEPVAEFFDFLVLGEGEEVIHEILDAVREWKNMGKKDRPGFLRRCASIPGVYVPSLYRVHYRPDGALSGIEALEGAPMPVRKRVVPDLDKATRPRRPLVPLVESVHDRCSLEIFRGCTRGCRFCQAGMVYRPVRERSEDLLYAWGREMISATGCDELSLSSLSSADYSSILSLAEKLSRDLEKEGVAVSLPSLRTDSFSVELASRVGRIRKTGLTLAPEAASPRLRAAINKEVTDEDLLEAVGAAYREGWRKIKLYFMVGLPGEEEEDVEAICALVRRIMREGDGGRPPRGLRLSVSVSTFVPKPHTPFQWARQISLPETARRHFILKEGLRIKGVTWKWHTREMSYLEGILARGDRRLGPVVEAAAREGCLDNWSEFFSWERWRRAMEEQGLDPAWYVERERSEEEVFPWEHLSAGVDRSFLWEEYRKALRGEPTPDCRYGDCRDCGACDGREVVNRLAGGGS
ncbi:TIGR03960 family B12-binding radical SAM protein [Candidatus Solincola sp.]|nr:TIGR03960 family B12-binding radical SAM protein [Actinomycetota bacterium]MDI7251350.1 TIGR03960 family B12-binding radical SAM protein [Actinomycetota bacterium]